RDLASLAGEETIFGGFAAEKLERLQTELEPLSRRYDVVVANPPYMGSSSLSKWMGAWVKKHYPEAYRDLCTSFIDQGFGMSSDNGYSAMVTMQSWMFLGSFEKLRGKILRNHSISSMAHLGTRAFGAIGGEVVSTTATVFANAKSEAKGAYFRLVDMGSEKEKQAGLLEALADPDCGWFYRASSAAFETVPGNPIAYWASNGVRRTFVNGIPLEKVSSPRQGLATGENERFLREWWEVSQVKSEYDCYSLDDLRNRRGKWIPYNKGGEYRKWYGNNDYVIAFDKDSYDVLANQGNHLPSRQLYFRPSITWSKISSGVIAFRFKPQGGAFDVAGTSIFGDKSTLEYLQGLCNSSLIMQIAALLSPTLNFEVGQIASYPVIMSDRAEGDVCNNVESARYLSKIDYDSFETSWDFEKHPLI
ncbi:Eco57I restriction-modification methylase domain-containing protein, partial [Slackia isoflavoniconvertens]|uniref:Eco57I restriction-modification methylase domain-containing protein n=1 Tax=Slackia isoflavoniconvertens TaxID=572010 RepID=UPI003AABE9EE